MSHITQVGIRRPTEQQTVGEAANGAAAHKVPVFPRLLFLKGANSAGLAEDATALSARQEAGRALKENGCAAMLAVHMRRAASNVEAAWRNEVPAAVTRSYQDRYILKPTLASADAARTPHAIVNALQMIFAPIVPWVSVSEIKSELQAMQADAQENNEMEMSPEDLAVMAMSPEQLEHFKAVFEAEFQNMAFEDVLPHEPLQ
ncbi:MAG: hypothetical protein JWR21_2345 [Herminiimonas sp.]|nr:hypothetical protein [Herminiimonas sp.]MDB5854204.1 hypothetical protein [Herminiimonas sp.]